jgi:hypothetical protein
MKGLNQFSSKSEHCLDLRDYLSDREDFKELQRILTHVGLLFRKTIGRTLEACL